MLRVVARITARGDILNGTFCICFLTASFISSLGPARFLHAVGKG